MHHSLLVVQGEMRSDGTVSLQYPVDLPPGPVEIMIRETSGDSETTREFLTRIVATNECLVHSSCSLFDANAEIDDLYSEIGGG